MNNIQKKIIIYIDEIMKEKYPTVIKYIKWGDCKFNSKCHWNSVTKAHENDDDKIALVWVSTKDKYPFLHFININSKGEYTENTLGWCPYYHGDEYRLIKFVEKYQFCEVERILQSYWNNIKKEINKKFPILKYFNKYQF